MTYHHWTLLGIALASLCMLDECAGAPVRRFLHAGWKSFVDCLCSNRDPL